MSILITGVTGHLGKILFKNILKSKKNFLLTYNKKKIETKKKNIFWIKKNILDKKKIYYKNFKAPETLLHLAWNGLDLKNYNSDIHIRQVNFHLNFIEELIKSGTRNIIVVGTCFEYGDYSGKISENFKTKPITKYGKAKDDLRKKIEKLKSKYQFNLIWLRVFYFYGGPNYKNDLWEIFNLAIKNKEKFFEIKIKILRDYLHIKDVVKIIWKLLFFDKDQV